MEINAGLKLLIWAFVSISCKVMRNYCIVDSAYWYERKFDKVVKSL